jgi:hypothetical protein
LQDESSSNLTSQGIAYGEEKKFQNDALRSQGLVPNLNCTLNPHGISTTFNPNGALPALNITFSPAFHNSPSTFPTIPKSQNTIQRLDIQQDTQCEDNRNIQSPSQTTIPKKACSISIDTFGSDSSLD